MQHNDITQKGTSRHLYTCCCGREIRICGNAGFDGKQNICTGFLESGHSEFRERSEIINIKILNGCVTMYTCVCVCVCVFVCVCVCVFVCVLRLCGPKLQRWTRYVFKKRRIVLCLTVTDYFE
jgi:hypothetical protein